MKPKISIVVPSFNQGRFIEEAICSVLEQKYPYKELIIIDGGSSDETVSILERYDSKLAYWISESDRGQAHAVNKGLDRATGDIIGWLNSDDKYALGAFQEVANAFTRSPEALVVYGNRVLLDADSEVSGWTVVPEFEPHKTGYVVCSETAFWRFSRVINERLREDLRFAMDLEFFCRLYQQGRFVKLNAFLGYFRCYLENKSSTIPEIGREEGVREWKTYFGEFEGTAEKRWCCHYTSMIAGLLLNPRVIAIPYLYRRFILRRRGI